MRIFMVNFFIVFWCRFILIIGYNIKGGYILKIYQHLKESLIKSLYILCTIFSSYKLKLCTHWTKTFLFPLPHPENKCFCCCWSVTQFYLTLCDAMDCRCQASLSFTIFQNLLKLMSISWWCHPTISSSVIPFSCLQSFPASGSFPVGQLFTSGDRSVGASASASVLPVNIQGWFPSG